MVQGRPAHATIAPAAPRVDYVQATPADLLGRTDTLAVLQFGPHVGCASDPRHLHIPLPPIHTGRPALECWRVTEPVESGTHGEVGWARSRNWLFAYLVVAEAEHDHDIGRTADYAYQQLCAFLAAQDSCRHVQRLWNYLDDINQGDGDAERYKHFCDGRVRGMGTFFGSDGYPAATAIGNPAATGHLTVYCLAGPHCGQRIENPRQLSAWRYPRQYGRTPPSFARAMSLPAGDALAISGTAAITGHESQHSDDLLAQLTELKANLDSLLDTASMPAGFDERAPLKVYMRHPEDAATIEAFLDQHMPGAPRLLLQGDVCRKELLVEIDGWRFV